MAGSLPSASSADRGRVSDQASRPDSTERVVERFHLNFIMHSPDWLSGMVAQPFVLDLLDPPGQRVPHPSFCKEWVGDARERVPTLCDFLCALFLLRAARSCVVARLGDDVADRARSYPLLNRINRESS